tara:strand:+ start:4108 stop:4608 length:501 start_codon:yes stop_codon:yes gene_type:complete
MGNCCKKYILGITVSSQNIKYPENLNSKNIPKYIPEINQGKVINIYDGDTITIAGYVKNNPKLFKFSVRLNNIDCPEIKSKKSEDKTEYEIAVKAKNFVEDLILNEIVYFKNVALDKYGRLLADVYFNNQNISNLLLLNNLAVQYSGKTKKVPKNWKKYNEMRILE